MVMTAIGVDVKMSTRTVQDFLNTAEIKIINYDKNSKKCTYSLKVNRTLEDLLKEYTIRVKVNDANAGTIATRTEIDNTKCEIVVIEL